MNKQQFLIILVIQTFSSEPVTKESLIEEIQVLRTNLDTANSDADTIWIMLSAFMVFFMQAGFAMLELGSVRAKNAINILIKNLLDFSLATLFWFFIGYGVAQGNGAGNFMGQSNQAGSQQTNQARDWLFQWAFAGTAATIVSGCLAERCFLSAQVMTSCCLTSFVQPVVVHWTWASDGWLATQGYTDFAGSGIVHLLGAVCGLIGAIFLGPRIGRFDSDTSEEEFRPHNTGMVTLGTMILWFGWQGFNGGSALGSTGANNSVIQAVCMNTTLSGATAGLVVFVGGFLGDGVESVGSLTNGLLAGLVGVTAGCDSATPWSSVGIGMVSGVVQIGSSKFIKYLEIDDPLDAFSVHGACGMWGVIASGLTRVQIHGADPEVLSGCVQGGIIIAGWTSACSVIIFTPLWQFNILRVPAEAEIKGLDEVFHGGLGYYLRGENKDHENFDDAVDGTQY